MRLPVRMQVDFDGVQQVTGAGRNGWQSLMSWGRQLISCRLCRNLTMAAFLAILVIESVILIPSYRNYEENLLSQHAAVARQAITTYLATKSDNVTTDFAA